MEERVIHLEIAVVAVAMIRQQLQILVNTHDNDSRISIPRGSVVPDCELTKSAKTILQREARIDVSSPRVRQVGTFLKPTNQTSERNAVVSIAYMAVVDPSDAELAEIDFEKHRFVPLEDFKHSRNSEKIDVEIAHETHRLLQKLIETTPVALRFCGSRFTLKQLRNVYEEILGHQVDQSNFRRKVMAAEGFIEPRNQRKTRVGSVGRPSDYYKRGLAEELDPPIRFRRFQ